MRPPVLKEAHRSHLQPCPRCGESNGITAIACWKCDLQLIPDHLLEPRQGPVSHLPPPVDVPRVDAEVPAETLEQLRVARHDGPHTLPPLSSPASHADTANDPHFGSVWASSQFRLLWVAVGLALAAAMLAWLVPRAPVDRPASQAATKVTSTVKVPPAPMPSDTAPRLAPATPAPLAADRPPAAQAQPAPQAALVSPPQVAVPPMGARGAVARARPAEPRPLVPPPAARAAVPSRDVRDDGSARLIEEATRRIDAEAARRPTPVQAPCTAQVAALGFCDSKQ
jgi:hypothetical protein